MYNDERQRVGTRKIGSHASAWEPETKKTQKSGINLTGFKNCQVFFG
jgi:hypothetical protein